MDKPGIRRKYEDPQFGIVNYSCLKNTYFQNTTKGLAFKYVAQGEETYLVNGKQIRVESNEYILLNQGTYYEAFIENRKDWTLGLCIDLYPGMFKKSGQIQSMMELMGNRPLKADLGGLGQYLRTLKESQWDQKDPKNRPQFLFDLKQSFFEHYNYLHHHYQHLKTKRKTQTRIDLLHRLERSRAYIRKNFREKISLSELSREAALSEYYLIRLFKQVYGVSPLAYQEAFRMEMAKEMIHNQDYSLSEIAHEIGYEDLPYFSRRFKKYFGLAPSHWRRMAGKSKSFL